MGAGVLDVGHPNSNGLTCPDTSIKILQGEITLGDEAMRVAGIMRNLYDKHGLAQGREMYKKRIRVKY